MQPAREDHVSTKQNNSNALAEAEAMLAKKAASHDAAVKAVEAEKKGPKVTMVTGTSVLPVEGPLLVPTADQGIPEAVYAAPPPKPSQPAKYKLGAFLKIPGGLSGRVTSVHLSLEEAMAVPEGVPKFGDKIVRGKKGPGALLTTASKYYYHCKSNALAYPLIVAELDASMISQGPDQ
jgi:hypothetical protein